MTQREALEILATARREQIVVTTMGSAGIWPEWSDTPLDFFHLPSSMGQGISLALGIALAQPTREVIAVMGDGSLLMNLGSLITVANHARNLRVVLIDNALYEVTGGQPMVGAGKTDFGGLARAAGFPKVYEFTETSAWSQGVGNIFRGEGPVFVWLRVASEYGKKTPLPPHPMSFQIARLQTALGITPQ